MFLFFYSWICFYFLSTVKQYGKIFIPYRNFNSLIVIFIQL